MKIIAGEWRGRTLKAPPGHGTRPTSGRMREALFSMLASRVGTFEDLMVLDLFAGTGALGLEALSRGAAHCTFIESDRAAVAALRANIEALGATGRASILTAADRLGPNRGALAHLAFLDAPYGKGLSGPALASLRDGGWLAPAALVTVETAKAEPLDGTGFGIEVERAYGKARLTLLRYITGD